MADVIDLKTFKDIGKKLDRMVEESGVDYIDAALEYCQKNGLEIEFIGELIAKNPSLRAKFESEAEDLNFIKKISRLPL